MLDGNLNFLALLVEGEYNIHPLFALNNISDSIV